VPSQHHPRQLALPSAALTAALLVGCSGASTAVQRLPPPPGGPVSSGSRGAPSPGPATASTGRPSGPSAPSAVAPTTGVAVPADRCPPEVTTVGVTTAVPQPQPVSGLVSFGITLTHSGGTGSCVLRGFPGVSFLDTSGRELGQAVRSGDPGGGEGLALGDTVVSVVTVPSGKDAVDDPDCRTRHVAQVRVFAPSQTVSHLLAIPVAACLGAPPHTGAVVAPVTFLG